MFSSDQSDDSQQKNPYRQEYDGVPSKEADHR